MSQDSIKLRRSNPDAPTAVKVDPRVRDALEIYKIRRSLRSMEAAAHVVLCLGLGLEDLLPPDLGANLS